MNKADLIDAVAEDSDLTKTSAARALDSAIENITNALKGGNSVTLVGFGTFTVRQREARMGRNPRTGEPIQIKASRVPGFKAGKALKDALNWRALGCLAQLGERRPYKASVGGSNPSAPTRIISRSGSSVG